LEAAIGRTPPARVYLRKLDGDGEAELLRLACGPAPDGRARWTLQLLADRLVELRVVEAIAANTVASVLKQTRCSRTGSGSGAYRA
jgi:hypothetical protein